MSPGAKSWPGLALDQRFRQIGSDIDSPAFSDLAAADCRTADREAVAPTAEHLDIPVDIQKFIEMGGVARDCQA